MCNYFSMCELSQARSVLPLWTLLLLWTDANEHLPPAVLFRTYQGSTLLPDPLSQSKSTTALCSFVVGVELTCSVNSAPGFHEPYFLGSAFLYSPLTQTRLCLHVSRSSLAIGICTWNLKGFESSHLVHIFWWKTDLHGRALCRDRYSRPGLSRVLQSVGMLLYCLTW